MSESDDIKKYINYWQTHFLADSSEKHLSHAEYLAWMRENQDRLAASVFSLDREAAKEYLQKEASKFVPKDEFDSWTTRSIFEDILNQIQEITKDTEFELKRKLIFAVKPSYEITPSVLPGEPHLFFFGNGTAKFCNYWSKVYAKAMMPLSQMPVEKTGREAIRKLINANEDVLFLPFMLAVYHAVCGNLHNFGNVVAESREETIIRGYALHSMEVFIVAHEYAHCLVEEKFERFRGQLDEKTKIELEAFCDIIAINISFLYHKKFPSIYISSGFGAVLFFISLAIFEETKEILKPEPPTQATHPSTSQRMELIRKMVLKTTSLKKRKEALSFLNGGMSIMESLKEETLHMIRIISKYNA